MYVVKKNFTDALGREFKPGKERFRADEFGAFLKTLVDAGAIVEEKDEPPAPGKAPASKKDEEPAG